MCYVSNEMPHHNNTPALHPDTQCIHAGQKPEPITGAVMPPIFTTSTYAQKSPGEHSGFEYSRSHNPTRYALESAQLQPDYYQCWMGIEKHFNPSQP